MSLEIFPPGRRYPAAEDGALDLHVDFIKGTHYGFDPVLVNFGKEAADGLLRSRTRRVGSDGRGRPG